jgi:hypothetical protein
VGLPAGGGHDLGQGCSFGAPIMAITSAFLFARSHLGLLVLLLRVGAIFSRVWSSSWSIVTLSAAALSLP